MSNEDTGFICLFRKILEWGWYLEINTKVLFIHMLLKANWKDGNFKGTTVPRGSFVSSVSKLAEETGLTIDEVRTAMGNDSGTVTIEIPVVIKGIGEIGRAVQQFDREYFKQHGKHAFTG